MVNKQKVFHVNLLKLYFSAVPSEPSPDDSPDESLPQDTTSTATPNVTFAVILEPEEEISQHGP